MNYFSKLKRAKFNQISLRGGGGDGEVRVDKDKQPHEAIKCG